MKLIPYHNAGRHAVHIGSKAIPPGETREVDATLVPGYRAAPVEADAPPPVTALLDGSAKDIVGALADLSDADLATLADVEAEGKSRKTVLEAITAIQLGRAQKAEGEGGETEGDGGETEGTGGEGEGAGEGEGGMPSGDDAD